MFPLSSKQSMTLKKRVETRISKTEVTGKLELPLILLRTLPSPVDSVHGMKYDAFRNFYLIADWRSIAEVHYK